MGKEDVGSSQELKLHLAEYAGRIAVNLGPISPAGEPEVREAGLDYMLEVVFNPMAQDRYLAKTREAKETEKLLRDLEWILTECTREDPYHMRKRLEMCAWGNRIISPTQGDTLCEIFSFNGQRRDINKLTGRQVSKLGGILQIAKGNLFYREDHRDVLIKYMDFQTEPVMVPKSKMPGTFVAERLRRL